MKVRGFTLLEMSVVLIIIGLVAGVVIVGKSLVALAAIRQEIKQIDSYKSAVNTFKLKYNALPGDMTNAASVGLAARSGLLGHGDNNGTINSVGNWIPTQCGEPSLFWNDLATAGLIEGGYKGTDHVYGSAACGASDTESLLPTAKIGDSNIIMANNDSDGLNYFTLCGGVERIGTNGELVNVAGGQTTGGGAISGVQASLIDSKIDDGNPLTGAVGALASCTVWATWRTVAIPATPATGVCVSNATNNPYNIVKSTGGESLSCILRFRF